MTRRCRRAARRARTLRASWPEGKLAPVNGGPRGRSAVEIRAPQRPAQLVSPRRPSRVAVLIFARAPRTLFPLFTGDRFKWCDSKHDNILHAWASVAGARGKHGALHLRLREPGSLEPDAPQPPVSQGPAMKPEASYGPKRKK